MSGLVLLDRAFGTESKVRVLRAMARSPHRWFTEADLARAASMSPNTVNLRLGELEDAGIIERAANGAPHPVRLQTKSPLAASVMQLFEAERRVYDDWVEAVRAQTRPDETCIVFGSVARGTARHDSDVDLLIIAPTLDRAAETAARLREATRHLYAGPLRMIHFTPAQVRARRGTPLLESIRREGVVIAGRPLEANA